MQTLKYLITIFILAIGILSFNPQNRIEPKPKIYVSGWDGDFAMIWKNGEPQKLSDTEYKRAYASSVIVNDGKVYASGCEGKYAVYWIDGKRVRLNNGNSPAFAMSISIVGNDIYVAGDELQGAFYVAKCWQNGIETSLAQSSYFTDAYSIFATPKNYYIVGNEQKTNAPTIARFWNKSGGYYLTDGQNPSTTYDVFITPNEEVYIAGEETENKISIAKYWLNGKSFNLTNGKNDAHARAIFVDGKNIYVGGEEYATRSVVAKYWVNGIAVNLSPDDPTIEEASVNAIFVKNNTVYCAGFVQYKGKNPVATYWVNTKPYYLSDGKKTSGATGIYVVD